jgi:predicted nucleotidyltransferase
VIGCLLAGQRTLTELADLTRLSKPTLLPVLKRLTDLGWVSRVELRQTTGREVAYRLVGGSLHFEVRPDTGTILQWASLGEQDDQFPLVSQVEDLQVREELLIVLRQLRKKWRKDFDQRFYTVVLYGSAARDEVTWKSDIDLMFVGDHEDPGLVSEVVQDAIADVQEFVSHPVRGVFETRKDFLAGEGRLVKEAAQEGMILVASRRDPIWRAMKRYTSISN